MSNQDEMKRGYRYGELHESQEAIHRAMSALERAQMEFRALVDQEKDPVRKEQLIDYLKPVNEAQNFQEVVEFRKQAIQTADQVVEVQRIIRYTQRTKMIAWFATLILIAITIITGFQEVYYYRLPAGEFVEADAYEGETVYLERQDLKLNFVRSGYAFRSHTNIRLVVAALLVIVAAFLTSTTLYREVWQ